jgi:hypothetical protein
MAKASTPERLYVGAMNDGLFIINRPPRPAPVDYLTEGDPETEVVATVHRQDLALAQKMAAAAALYVALETRLMALPMIKHHMPVDHPVWQAILDARDALAKARVAQPEA